MSDCPLCQCPENKSVEVESRLYKECFCCGLVWLDAKFHLSSQEELGRYHLHENRLGDLNYRKYLQKFWDCVFPYLPANKGSSDTLLGMDFGCGPVKGMDFLLASKGFSVHSFDPFFFPQYDLLNISYDFVLCSEAAEHFYFPQKEFHLLSQITKTGGILGVSSQLFIGWEKFPQWYYRRDPTHVCFYSLESIHWIARTWGWKIEKVESPYWVLRRLATD